jgi:diguanylate cyclase
VSTARELGLDAGTRPQVIGGHRVPRPRVAGAGEWTRVNRAVAGGAGGYVPTAVNVGLMVVAWALNLMRLPEPWGWAVFSWLPAAAAMAVATWTLWRTASAPHLAPAARRFWRQYAVVVALGTLSLVIRAADAATADSRAAEGRLPVATVVVGCASVCLAIWALLRLPVPRRTRAEWTSLVLDMITIVLGAALIMWYVSLGPLVTESPQQTSVWGPIAIGTLCLVAFGGVVKIVLVGSDPIDPVALRLLGGSMLAGGLSAGTATLISAKSSIAPGQVAVPVVAALVTLAARRQTLVARHGPAHRLFPRPHRPYSRLPYVAVLATDVLLVVATFPSIGLNAGVVVAGVITVTAVVAFRQLAAFSDNARLVRQLRGQEDRLRHQAERLRHQAERLRHQADHDALTQLANRTVFTERLDAALALDPADRLAVLLIDLDDFKSVNDTLGHAVGDRLLLAVADRLENCIRGQDTVARLGGDEFGVLLRGVDPAVADATAARILASLSAPVVTEEHHLLVRASIGVAVAAPGDDSGTMLRNADIAMYAAKERGKNVHLRYVPGMATNVLEHAQLGAQLREAIAAGRLYPVFQPVMHLTEHRILGIETLVRWRHPARGVVLPTDFIQTAERTGLIVPMGGWLVREACAQLAAWKRAYGAVAPATIGVNVSGRQLAEPNFPAEIAAAVALAGLDPHNLVLEITEDSVLTGGHVIETLKALSDFGVMIALDDFGTGQSSLGVLRSCPVDILKLDKSFVEGIGEGTQQAAIATAVVKMAQAMGLDAVAEGIEDDAQVDFLLGIDYHLGQGFHLARPLPAEDVAKLFGKPTVTARRRRLNGARPKATLDLDTPGFAPPPADGPESMRAKRASARSSPGRV